MEHREQIRSIGDYTDTEGRLLAERGAQDTADHVFEMRTCPYRDTRHGQEMNVDALRQIRAHWDDILPAIRILERDNIEIFGAEAGSLVRLRRLTRVLGSLPEFLALFSGTKSGEIPVLAAVLYKIARGLNTVTNRLTLDEPRTVQDIVALSADTFYAYIDRHSLLVGQDEVCAGPKSQIVEVLAALSGDSAPGTGAEGATGSTSVPNPLDAIFSETERRAAVRYGVGLSDHLLVRSLFTRIFAVFSAARTASTEDHRRVRGEVARILAMPCIATPGLQPPVLDAVLAEARRVLSGFVVTGPAPVPDGLVARLDALWLRAMEERRREVAGLARNLGRRLSAEIRINDIPERHAAPAPSAPSTESESAPS